MQYEKLGKNGPVISTIGFGAWGISGRDWGKTDDEKSKRALHQALDSGITFIDTADTYGSGHSEKLISEVLDERGRKDEVVIATKAGNNFYPYLGEEHETTPANPDYSKKHLVYAAKFGNDDHQRFNLSPEKLEQYLSQIEHIDNFFEKHKDYSMAQLSLRFCISHPGCHVAIPGGKTPEQVKENAVASDIDIKHTEFPE